MNFSQNRFIISINSNAFWPYFYIFVLRQTVQRVTSSTGLTYPEDCGSNVSRNFGTSSEGSQYAQAGITRILECYFKPIACKISATDCSSCGLPALAHRVLKNMQLSRDHSFGQEITGLECRLNLSPCVCFENKANNMVGVWRCSSTY